MSSSKNKIYYEKATLNRLQNFLVSNLTSPEAEMLLIITKVSPTYKGVSKKCTREVYK
jgi:hypothetical protein